MTASNSGKSLRETLIEESAKPLTFKDRIGGIALALAFIAVGASMIVWPAFLSVDDENIPSGRGGRTIAVLLEVVWSRPVGGLLILLALLMVWGSITKKSAEA